MVAFDEFDACETLFVLQKEVHEMREFAFKHAENFPVEPIMRQIKIRIDIPRQLAKKHIALAFKFFPGKGSPGRVFQARVSALDHFFEDSPGEGHLTEIDRK